VLAKTESWRAVAPVDRRNQDVEKEMLLRKKNSAGIATAELSTMIRSVVRRPTASESQPERTRPPTLPTAPTSSAVAP